ncbi:MAG: hypothetical protein GY713_11840 [Actinomycetia bacterium]|nr:hypothetical protein [Actinomycetes bacterium]
MASDGASDDHLGTALAVSGSTVVVTSYLSDPQGDQSGSAYVWVEPAGGWSGTLNQSAKLLPSDGRTGTQYGRPSVAVSGTTVVVGAYRNRPGHDRAGPVYLYEEPAGGWSGTLYESAKLQSSDLSVQDFFAWVGISGSTVVVGARLDDDNGSNSGSAYVFEEPAGGWSGTLNESAKLLASDGAADDYFGGAVAISGSTVVVAASLDDDNGSNSGSAYVFEEPAGGWSGTLNESVKLLASDGALGDGLGASLAISGTAIVVGAFFDDDNGTSSGSAYVFDLVPPPTPPAFSKAFSPQVITPGGTSTLTFTIDNSLIATTTSALDFTDNLPAGVTVAATPNASTTCTGGTPTATAASGTISYSGGSVAAGASCTVQADVTSSTLGAHVNTSGALTSDAGSSGTATATLTVNLPPAVTVLEPDGAGDTVDASFLIQWSDEDGDDDAAISLFYDTDASGEDGVLITDALSEDPDGAGNDDFTWDTTVVPDGAYFIYAVIDDGVNPPVVDYSAGPVTVASTQTVDFTNPDQSNAESVRSEARTAGHEWRSRGSPYHPQHNGGTAADPADYSPDTATITIPAGALSADLTLTVVDDALDEVDETVVVTMGVPVNAMAGTVTVHTATIEDDDPAPTVSFTSPAQSNAESVASVTVTAELSALSGKEVQVPLTFAGTAADPGDYSPDTATLVIPVGQMSADVTLTVVDDALDEGSEIVDVSMGTPVNAGLGAVTVHTAIIQDDDPPPAVEFTTGFQSNLESVSPVTVTAELSVVSGKEVHLPVSFSGTAVDPGDYSPSGTAITIPAGQLSAGLTLAVVDDALDEGSELVDVTMGTPVNAVAGTVTVHTVLIQDNDAPPQVDFTSPAQSNAESVSPATVTAELSAVSGRLVQVPLVFGGDADDPGDYSPDTAILMIPAGQTEADLTLTVVDDGDNENDETVVVTLGAPVNAVPGTTTVHTVTIEDDEGPSITVLEPDGLGDLADDRFTIMWTDADPNDDAVIDLYYDTDSSGEDGTVIASGLAEDPDGAGTGNDDFEWDTSALPGGDYFVYAVIDDGFHPPVVDYGDGPVTVNRPPVIAVLEPDGVYDSADDDFLIVWEDADGEDDASIDLYYDVDGGGEDGTFITTLGEDPDGAGDRHLWDTRLVTDGSYFVYAAIDDGVNPPVVDYSAGPLTVDHSAVACEVPASGDWMVNASCTLTASDTAPGDVIVVPGVVLTIDNGVTLSIDLVNHKLLVQPGGGVLVRPLGSIRQP